ncbi:hypothetical protein ACHAQH_003168 [Verticillium albo-atrum]
MHLDNQFLLLREDMLAELKDDINTVMGKQRGKGSPQILGKLEPIRITTGTEQHAHLCTLLVKCGKGLGMLDNLCAEQRKKLLLKDDKKIVGHPSFRALCDGSEIVGFGFTVRDVDQLAEYTVEPPKPPQFIVIGDHKHLRPKIKNYALAVECGDGFDLNRSLFERLILQGHPHTTLCKQHRMHPEISLLVRHMSYPDLLDGDQNEPEIGGAKASAQPDVDFRASKPNLFEAQKILKLVKYLGQQGHGTSDLVVLTPYLGQLSLLRDELSKENDPLLNDLDSAELIRAGLETAAAGKIGKSKIRLSTIDNCQGEESEIVIASLTRSNNRGDIGVLKAPERLNVLVSRARSCLIMIGDMETFIKSAQGQHVWMPFFKLMREKNYLQDGLWKCFKEDEEHRKKDEELRRRALRNFELEKQRLDREASYRMQLRQLDEEIEDERRILKAKQTSEEQKTTLNQRQADLLALKETRARQEAMKKSEEKSKSAAGSSPPTSSKPESEPTAGMVGAKQEWETMKRAEGARSDALAPMC